MKTRQEIKAQAKANFKGNYWKSVGVTLLLLVIAGGLGATLIGIFAAPHIAVALAAFSLGMYRTGNFGLGESFEAGFTKFFRKLGSFVVMEIFLSLWTCLLVIPGIVKTFSYAMTQFILADCPEVKAIDAITLSRRMMKGHKFDLFVLELSFIGWQILATITCGILDVFYVVPYMQFTVAGFYDEVKNEAIADGRVTVGQLEGTEAV